MRELIYGHIKKGDINYLVISQLKYGDKDIYGRKTRYNEILFQIPIPADVNPWEYVRLARQIGVGK